ncbi:helix-turn-helix domain-containing protein [Pedobacter jamesrossensis]|uniref:Helix-turn-helix domain-containing protein n=1 Tax=Pedobacter jamesrossensis TaxID=1908238 RepID=A0ABV8NNP1_9SPHI
MATKNNDLFYIEISELDYLLIERVKALRLAKNFTQLQLTQKMKLADGFISKVETYTERAKYSIRHIYLLASALNCNIQDILPLEQPKHDIVRLTLKRSNKINKDGSISRKKFTEVIKIEPINNRQN